MSFIWDCIALVIPIGPERRDDLRKEVLTPCSSERCQVVRNGGGCKLAWEELLQRPNAHREDVDPDPNVPEVGSSQEKAHLLTIPQRARRNHSLSGVGTYVLRDSLHHGLHMLRKTTSAASVACLCEIEAWPWRRGSLYCGHAFGSGARLMRLRIG